MADLLQFFIDVKDSVSGLNQLILLVTTLGAAILFLVRKTIRRLRDQRFLVKRLMPFYDEQVVERATGIYIPTRCQNVDPAQEDEPGSVHAYVAKNRLIPLLTKLLQAGEAAKYYIVLADTGMGKTTFMLNFFLRYARKWRARYQVRLFPLGDPRTDAAIDRVEDREDTVLLLDAFDEDGLAIIDFGERLDQLIEKTRDFRCVVMSSRTQFFPSHVEEPAKTGVLKHGGEKGEHEFKKFYLSPFDNRDIRLFVRKRYAWYQRGKRRRARRIVEACPYLVVRPMLLSYIDDLMAEEVSYQYPHQIYEAMVQRWIRRERVENKEDLRRFSEAIALHMYRHQKERKGLFVEAGEIVGFAEEHGIKLEEFELKSRSLLNRDAEGRWKFAHKSILEYFLALELLRNPEVRKEFEIGRMEFAGLVLESLREAYLRHVVGQTRDLVLPGLEPGEAGEEPETAMMRLAAVYTPLSTLAAGADAGLSALEQLDRHPRLVLLGEPGSGKSTFARFVALCLAGEALGLDEANLETLTAPDNEGGSRGRRQAWKHGPLLPVRLVLGDFAARGLREHLVIRALLGRASGSGDTDALWHFIAGELDRVWMGGLVPELRRELAERGGLLLLDGLEEVPEGLRPLVRQIVAGLCQDLPQCRVLVTSRGDAYRAQAGHLPGFAEATLAPWNDGQIRRFVSRWYDEVIRVEKLASPGLSQRRCQSLLEALGQRPLLKEMAGTPLLLTMFARKGIANPEVSVDELVVEEDLKALVVRVLTRLMQNPDAASEQRLEAGLWAAELGDLPPDLDAWVEIPADELAYPFKIGKYPVTNAQYRRFVASGGYDRENGWFSEEAQQKILEFEKEYGEGEWPAGPRYEKTPHLNRLTQPVVGVGWYEAAAYAAWLTADLRQAGGISDEEQVRLPTVAEWHRAAGGAEGRKYSWGGRFDPRRANTKESGLSQPTPVHMYPAGATSEGVFDLTGNVWEWTVEESSKGIFTLAGGAYWDDADGVGASARSRSGRFLRLDSLGFRVAVFPISRADS